MSGRWARTRAGRSRSTRAASPSSTSSNAGSTHVPPGAARDRISDTASTASWSAETASSSHVPGSRRRLLEVEARERIAAGRPRGRRSPEAQLLAQALGSAIASPDSFANASSSSRCFFAELRRDDDVGDHVEVTA